MPSRTFFAILDMKALKPSCLHLSLNGFKKVQLRGCRRRCDLSGTRDHRRLSVELCLSYQSAALIFSLCCLRRVPFTCLRNNRFNRHSSDLLGGLCISDQLPDPSACGYRARRPKRARPRPAWDTSDKQTSLLLRVHEPTWARVRTLES